MADNYSQFHQLWGACVGVPGYEKKYWQFLSVIMDRADKNTDIDTQEKVVFFANLLAESQAKI
ncbi:MAG: hypothetical protein P1P90_05465 [Patescibacteria group bacterium]|nr:hypothetical protein [Patescibacteria group bacterium]